MWRLFRGALRKGDWEVREDSESCPARQSSSTSGSPHRETTNLAEQHPENNVRYLKARHFVYLVGAEAERVDQGPTGWCGRAGKVWFSILFRYRRQRPPAGKGGFAGRVSAALKVVGPLASN